MEIRYSQRVKQYTYWYNMLGYKSSICSIGTSVLPSFFLPVSILLLSLCMLLYKQEKQGVPSDYSFRNLKENTSRKAAR